MKAFMLAFAMMLSQSGCTLWARHALKNIDLVSLFDECRAGWHPRCK
jgi:hypothetical protein